jgi:hypothetical protein
LSEKIPLWWNAVLQGVLQKNGRQAWCFYGLDVVLCVAKVDMGMTLFGLRK